MEIQKINPEVTIRQREIKTGKLYKHYNGKFYKILAIAHYSEDPSLFHVVYQGLYDCPTFGPNPIWTRPYSMFIENVVINGKEQARFEEVTEACKDIFSHEALTLTKNKPFIFTAMSKHLFYYRMYISKFVLELGNIPINPFMSFDYFLLDSVDRNLVREANNNLLKRSDELWVFGTISDGVLAEIQLAKHLDKPIQYFKITTDLQIMKLDNLNEIDFEAGLHKYQELI